MPRAVRAVDPLTIGSGARLRELYKIPRWFAVSLLVIRGMFRHYLLTASFIVGLYLWYLYGFGLYWLAFLTVLFVWVGVVGIYWRALGGNVWSLYYYVQLMWRWRHAVANVGLRSRDGNHIPRISRVRPVKDGLRMNVNMRVAGRGVVDLQAEAADLCEVLGYERQQVFPLGPGKARFVLLKTKESTSTVIDVRSLEGKEAGSSVDRLGSSGDVEELPIGDHTKLVVGKTPSGNAIVSLLLSIFIAGMSNSGKSNLIRVIFHGLIRQNIPHKLYVIDPGGGVELGELEHYPHTVAYCDNAADADKVIKRAHADMFARLRVMKSIGKKKVFPSKEFPLQIVLIDELLLLGDQISAGVEGELGQLLIVHRKTAGLVIALSQLSNISETGIIRRLFPQRICFATDAAETTDGVLGKGAEAAGAKCSEIPQNMPGVGYMRSEERRGFTRFRAAEAQGSLLEAIAKASARDDKSENKNKNRRCARYRYYNVLGKALYIGVGFNPEERAKRHAVNSLWWGLVDHTRTKIDWWKNEEEALIMETAAIHEEKPLYNTAKQLPQELPQSVG